MPSDLALRMRRARETLGISMQEAERVTKIRRKYLEAIEAGDFALVSRLVEDGALAIDVAGDIDG